MTQPRASSKFSRSSARSTSARLAPRAVAQSLELLEPRRLLAGDGSGAGAFDLANTTVYTPTTTDLKDAKHGPMGNTGSDLINIYVDYRRSQKSGANFKNPSARVDVRGDTVGVSIRVRGKIGPFVRMVRDTYGMRTTGINDKLGFVQGYVKINHLRELAARRDVVSISAIYKAITQKVGTADNQGDRALNSDQVRVDTGLTGKGVKVGVLSDSANWVAGGLSDSIANGDLPNNFVQIVDDSVQGADEGRAMMELIHDIAPGANLAFATASNGQQAYADNIEALQAVGATVIVDDILYTDQPAFQEGVIDNAIRKVVRKNAVYLGAAGNSDDQGFIGDLNFTTVGGRTLADFNTGSTVDTRFRATLRGDFVFQWDNPYNGVTGAADVDVDIRMYRPGTNTVLAEALDNNLATGRPIEFISVSNPFRADGDRVEIEIEISQQAAGASFPTKWILAAPGNGTDIMRGPEYTVTRSGMWGHKGMNSGISVAAVPWFDAPPFQTSGNINTEDFSSFGPGMVLFDPNGNRLSKVVLTQKPDIAGIDNINTSFFPSSPAADITEDSDVLPNFSGTSAAAPNVAAVVALVREADPTLTQAEILNAMKLTARPVNGAAQGTWDEAGGYGLVDAAALIPTLISDPSVEFSAVSPNPRDSAINSVTINFNQPVEGFTLDDLSLSVNGGPNLLGDSIPQQLQAAAATLTTDDNTVWTLAGLSALTGVDGKYTLRLIAQDSDIKNYIDKALEADALRTWEKLPVASLPVVPPSFKVAAMDSASILLNWADVNAAELGYTVIRATDPAMTLDRKTFQLPANSTSFVNEGLKPVTKYYYRVRAWNLTGSGPFTSPTAATTLTAGDFIVDNTSSRVRISGAWSQQTTGSGYLGPNYLTDGNSGKGEKSVRYIPGVATPGSYFIYARWNRASGNATNARYDIFYGPESDQRQTIYVDQRNRGGSGWVLLGKYTFAKDFNGYVRLSNTGTNGVVVADAMRFLSDGPLSSSSGKSQPQSFRSDGALPPFSGFGSGSIGGANGQDDDDRDLLGGI